MQPVTPFSWASQNFMLLVSYNTEVFDQFFSVLGANTIVFKLLGLSLNFQFS